PTPSPYTTLCRSENQAAIRSSNITPSSSVAHKGISGSHCRIPKLLAMAQSLVINNKNAKRKLTKTVVRVKKILMPACLIFLYFSWNRGTIYSNIQKKVMPDTRIRLLWDEGIVSK